MSTTTFSSREFNQDTGRAKKATVDGPVFITDRGRPSYVLLTIEEYARLAGTEPTIGRLLASPEAADIDFEPSRMGDSLSSQIDLS